MPIPATGITTETRATRHEARIDGAALRRNLTAIGPGATVDLSADAYGHGAALVAGIAREHPGVDFAVRLASERAALRTIGVEARLLADGELASGTTEGLYGVGGDPVMRLSASIISTKTIEIGDGVSYGYTWRASRPTALALVPLGYADGLWRAAGNAASLLLRGRLRPIVGRVAMDVCVVEVGPASSIGEVAVGDEAVLFGDTSVPGVRLEDWATTLGLPPLSVTAGIAARVPRVAS